ncbi:MAG: GNAT family N-acetyltransferase, partial [Acidobacteria bacterium]|nr:GNAT family N-acetyltransferase [Acidobacteriota bacterium]
VENLPREEIDEGKYLVRFVRTPEELDAVLKLRFEVFNLELAEGLDSSFLTGRDQDEFDLTCHHLVILDKTTAEIVGTYRLRTIEMAREAGGFYSAGEFNLSCLPPYVLEESVEIGRACIARPYRNTKVLFLLWKGLATYLAHNRKRYLFGCCSLASQEPQEGTRVFDYLERSGHLHPTLYVPPRRGFECDVDDLFVEGGREPSVPRLFQTYLSFGARVCGRPAIDRQFKTIDFLVTFDTEEMDEKSRRTFFGA